jgi:3-(3-hydroxy-phenyl)propionate hydroxylase
MPERAVLVVGAGPVGLTAALALRVRGLDVTVLESGPEGQARPGSRAIFYHRRTLEHWEKASPGLGWAVARAGLVCSTKRAFWGDRQVFERTYQPPSAAVLPHASHLSQADVEALIYRACQASGVEFAWNHEVTGARAGDRGVLLEVAGGRSWRARYVVGADGPRSVLREAAGVTMEGSPSPNAFVIVDVAEDPQRPLRPERVYYYAHPAAGRRHVLLVPFAGGWRADLMLRETDDPQAYDDPGQVARFVGQVLPERYAQRVTWVSTYRFRQAVGSSFTDPSHRILLAGEAAHLFAPFGARGLNSGVADAMAAAAAIAAALGAGRGDDAAREVADYAGQRRAAALYNRDASSLALAHMRANGLRIRVKRRLAAELALRGGRAGAWLDASPFGPKAAARGGDEVY